MANLLRGVGAALVTLLLLGMSQVSASALEPTLGGAQIHHLPPGLGASTDFHYEFARVNFDSRVWESGSDATGWRVDLDIIVMHGARLKTLRALHDWFIRYEQRPTAEAHYTRTWVHAHRAWACRDQVFWLVRPGVAVSVQIDRGRWSRHALFSTARGVHLPSGA